MIAYHKEDIVKKWNNKLEIGERYRIKYKSGNTYTADGKTYTVTDMKFLGFTGYDGDILMFERENNIKETFSAIEFEQMIPRSEERRFEVQKI